MRFRHAVVVVVGSSIGWLALIFATWSPVGCSRGTRDVSGPLPQAGYLWQRDWTPAVADAVSAAEKQLDGIVVLGAEIVWVNNKPEPIMVPVDWTRMSQLRKRVSVALRVAPFTGVIDGNNGEPVAEVARRLVRNARSQGATLASFQLDFDCAQKDLAAYRTWVRMVRAAVKPLPLILTTLPSWLDEPEFAALIGDVDSYVLQVHSVSTHSQRAQVCDPVLARQWVAKAAKIGRKFSVALPTYRCEAGYDQSGKLISVALDGVAPVWPAGTRLVEFAADADAIAALVREWTAKRPPELQGLFWYRLPVVTDERNWRWPTLAAVINGRAPLHKLEVRTRGENPVDLFLANAGEADQQRDPVVTVAWKSDAAIVASDALPGWKIFVEPNRAVFRPLPGTRLRLSPQVTASIGWLRYDRNTEVQPRVEEMGLGSR